MAPPLIQPAQKLKELRNKARQNTVGRSQNGASENGETAARGTSTSNVTSKVNEIYKSKACRPRLERGNGSVRLFMSESRLFTVRRGPRHGLSKDSEEWIRKLKEKKREDPNDGRFQAKVLQVKLPRLQNKNEMAVIIALQDLVCPEAEELAELHLDDKELAEKYDLFANLWNEQWAKQPQALPGFGTPRPDYCVGFSLSAFTEEQSRKLDVLSSEKTVLMPTTLMHFPFLTCEVKSWQQSLDFADNQNAHNIYVAVQAMVELFRMAKRESDIDGQILAFSVSYNHSQVAWHAYYPVIKGERTDICRRPLFKVFLSPDDNPNSWRSWNLARNLYELWAPDLYHRLCKAIDAVELDVQLVEPAAVAGGGAPAPAASVDQMDGLSEATVRPEAMSLDGDGGDHGRNGRGATEQPEEQPPPKRNKVG
ncbi:uncharacterized protein LTHEOB_11860 [Neofusicoccum parvum]|uniref:Uncharacterized protein LTHEOB_11860 n=1 Tax=Neofusicoccum parvum TaxID=310453 RepID=A0ACB5SK25_9PEZI|nr:uncharacterized protein LTHEOB_11860 [Neofusicoccum parvum]